MQKIKKVLSIISYYLVPLSLIVGALVVSQKGFGAENDLYGLYGNLAMILLVIIVFLKPLSQIFTWKWFKIGVAFRRQLGVAAFWCALFHGMLYVRLYDLFSLESFIGKGNTLYLLGVVGLIGMILLGITSNNFSVRLLKKRWKQLHYSVYGIFFVVLWHAGISQGKEKTCQSFDRFFLF